MEDPACAVAHSEVTSADAIAHGDAPAPVDGRTLEFRVEAHDEKDLIGDGTHTRLVVNVARFDQRVQAKLK